MIILDWERFLVCVILILVPVLFLLLISKEKLHRVAQTINIFPNLVSVMRVPIHYFGMALLRMGLLEIATIVLSVAWMLDNTDGKLSRASKNPINQVFEFNSTWENFRLEFRYDGKTSIGAWLDPMADKLQTLPSLGRLVFWEKALDWRWYLVMLSADLIGTGIRPPFTNGERSWLRKVAATWLGKIKTTFQFSAIGSWGLELTGVLNPSLNSWGFETLSWFSTDFGVSDLFLCLATIFACLSVLSKLNLGYLWCRIIN